MNIDRGRIPAGIRPAAAALVTDDRLVADGKSHLVSEFGIPGRRDHAFARVRANLIDGVLAFDLRHEVDESDRAVCRQRRHETDALERLRLECAVHGEGHHFILCQDREVFLPALVVVIDDRGARFVSEIILDAGGLVL